jgi:hypothetical protein
VSRDSVIERSIRADEHTPVGQLRDQAVDGLVEPDQTFLDQGERGRRGDRLGDRRDPEERVARDRRPADRQPAERLDVHLVPVRHQGDEPRNLLVADVTGGDLAQLFDHEDHAVKVIACH